MRLALVMYGDPRNTEVWSGAPRKFYDALAEFGVAVMPINALTANRPVKLGQLLLHGVQHWNLDFRRSWWHRAHNARRARREVDRVNVNKVLHLSVNHLPLPTIRDGEEHYLFTDFTYDLRLGANDSAGRTKFQQRVDELDRAAYRQMTHIFTASAYVRDNLVRHYGVPQDRLSVVGYGFSMGSIRPTGREKDYSNGQILFSSKIHGGWEYKGGALLVEAFKLAWRQNKQLKLSLVGRDEYAQLAAGVPNVTAHGHVSWRKLQELFDRAALFAMPALQEPWGTVYLEAMACRTPILGLDRYAFAELSNYGTYGFICRAANPESVAETLLEAMSSPARLKAMGEGAQGYCLDRFTWELVAKRICTVIFPDSRRLM